MADIIPFKSIRYNENKVSIGDVATKPYDKISPEEQDNYYAKSPYNFVRLILGKQSSDDTAGNNRYTRAAQCVDEWLKENVLIQEDAPAFYIYDQSFQCPGFPAMKRRALIGLGRVVPYSDKVIFPHERTLTGPKKDRLALTEATQCQFGQLFMLYKDEPNEIDSVVNKAIESQKPVYEFKDKMGVDHKVYILTDSPAVTQIQKIMADKQLLIADGHHRYETALNYYNAMKEKSPDKGEAYAYHLMSFVNIYDPGLLILPTHRVVRNVAADIIESYWDKITGYFNIETVKKTDFVIDMICDKTAIKLGVYRGDDNIYILTLKDKKAVEHLMTSGKPEAWYDLPVTVLHDVILEAVLEIDKEKLAAYTNVTYAENCAEGMKLVDKENHQAAFFVPPTSIESVCDIAFAGETMPQKSTDFYPKIYSGLVFNKLV